MSMSEPMSPDELGQRKDEVPGRDLEGLRIRDNPTFKKLLDEAHSMEQFKRVLPFVTPFLTLLGVPVDKIEAALVDVDRHVEATRALTSLPDRFNAVFVSRGWIMYDMMNVDIAHGAVEKADAGDVDAAECDLVAYYDEKTVEL